MSSPVETSVKVGAVHRTGPSRTGVRRRFEVIASTCPPKGMFASLDVYHDIDSRSAAMNMAVDEALLEIAKVPTIRFYQWDHSALSFGYFGKFEEVNSHDRDIVRRWTGGGIVFHGEDLTYSVVIPATDDAFAKSSKQIYEEAHRAVRHALINHGVFAELSPVAGAYERPTKNPALVERRYNECFANPVRADVVLNGRKIAGAAQRRTRHGLLHQGSIQGVDLGNGFADRFAENLSQQTNPKQLNDPLIVRAQQIAKEKYDTAAWLKRR